MQHPDFQFFQRYGKSRVKGTGKVLALFYAAYDRQPPQGIERKMRLGAWCDALSSVPEASLLPLAQQELRVRTNKYFPTPADLISRFSGEESTVGDDGKTEKATRANVAAYESWDEQKARRERAANSALPESLPPLEIDPDELKKRLGIGGRAAEIETPTSPDAPDSPWSAALTDTANALNIELDACTPQQLADLRGFTVWWLKKYPRHELTPELFSTQWANFTWWRDSKRKQRLA